MIEIDALADRPEHFETIADRIWSAWWKEKGDPLERITEPLRACLDPRGIPFALVAHRDGGFLGTASVIASDLEERPDLTPWVAALWVEPAYRRRGIGAALLHRTIRLAAGLGTERLYLHATNERRGFYERRGWHLHPEASPEPGMSILALPLV